MKRNWLIVVALLLGPMVAAGLSQFPAAARYHMKQSEVNGPFANQTHTVYQLVDTRSKMHYLILRDDRTRQMILIDTAKGGGDDT